MRKDGLALVETVTQLLQRLLEYRDVINEENKENQMSCTVNLLVCTLSFCKIILSYMIHYCMVDHIVQKFSNPCILFPSIFVSYYRNKEPICCTLFFRISTMKSAGGRCTSVTCINSVICTWSVTTTQRPLTRYFCMSNSST